MRVRCRRSQEVYSTAPTWLATRAALPTRHWHTRPGQALRCDPLPPRTWRAHPTLSLLTRVSSRACWRIRFTCTRDNWPAMAVTVAAPSLTSSSCISNSGSSSSISNRSFQRDTGHRRTRRRHCTNPASLRRSRSTTNPARPTASSSRRRSCHRRQHRR